MRSPLASIAAGRSTGWRRLVVPLLLLAGLGAAAAGPLPPVDPAHGPTEPVATALAQGRLRVEELRGRAVYAYDETHIGTLAQAGRAGVIALDPRLRLGRKCLAVTFSRLRLAAEGRLLLDMNVREFQAAAVRSRCEI